MLEQNWHGELQGVQELVILLENVPLGHSEGS
jgi:hypothetical protein